MIAIDSKAIMDPLDSYQCVSLDSQAIEYRR